MENLKKTLATLLLLGVFTGTAWADSSSAAPGDVQAKMQGKDSFSLGKLPGWAANTEDANRRGMYAYFTRRGYTFDDSPAVIYIRLLDKTGLSIAEHLKADMDRFAKNKIADKIEPFKISGLKYASVAKKYFITDTACDYVCYLDPGKSEQAYLIFVLTARLEYCDTYKDDFTKMVKSFIWGKEAAAPSGR